MNSNIPRAGASPDFGTLPTATAPDFYIPFTFYQNCLFLSTYSTSKNFHQNCTLCIRSPEKANFFSKFPEKNLSDGIKAPHRGGSLSGSQYVRLGSARRRANHRMFRGQFRYTRLYRPYGFSVFLDAKPPIMDSLPKFSTNYKTNLDIFTDIPAPAVFPAEKSNFPPFPFEKVDIRRGLCYN